MTPRPPAPSVAPQLVPPPLLPGWKSMLGSCLILFDLVYSWIFTFSRHDFKYHMLYGSGCVANLILTHEIFFRQITFGIFSQIHDFLNHCYIFTRKYIYFFYFKHSLDTVNSLSRSNFLVLLLFKPWLSSSCTSSIENYILRLLEAALGRRALGRRRQALRLFLGCCTERASGRLPPEVGGIGAP